MANIKISELKELTNIADDDLFVVVDESQIETKKIKKENILLDTNEKINNKLNKESVKTINTESDIDTYSCNYINNLIYPVGSIYMSINNTNPSILFGGVWERIEDVLLLGASLTYEAGSTGGEATHVLTIDEMPIHSHNITGKLARSEASSGNNYNLEKQRFVVGRNKFSNSNTSATDSSASFINVSDVETSTMLGISSTGEGQAHNNMPPYLAVYMWKRIS